MSKIDATLLPTLGDGDPLIASSASAAQGPTAVPEGPCRVAKLVARSAAQTDINQAGGGRIEE
ncbi:hypothetical protein FHS29_004432 [Saccharothrix tamanrassetensis]|uniref:Uncharacterized protein n=1 Tax=Saccharothrix tamanrassetensis TaxID=1051531 RepID=A0A841CP37_9PSEU|nr:hypothetical protein [Saccharothrix tamanrassetensis]MBB5957837.1 hypothetical protein [Saccharothrix tamanrassetensis]